MRNWKKIARGKSARENKNPGEKKLEKTRNDVRLIQY